MGASFFVRRGRERVERKCELSCSRSLAAGRRRVQPNNFGEAHWVPGFVLRAQRSILAVYSN
jgi:hypothetical protein